MVSRDVRRWSGSWYRNAGRNGSETGLARWRMGRPDSASPSATTWVRFAATATATSRRVLVTGTALLSSQGCQLAEFLVFPVLDGVGPGCQTQIVECH